eukprot:141920_1
MSGERLLPSIDSCLSFIDTYPIETNENEQKVAILEEDESELTTEREIACSFEEPEIAKHKVYSKIEYPINSCQDIHIIPYCAKVVTITPQQDEAKPLIIGYCKSIMNNKYTKDIQCIVLQFYCINTIEIYIEKSKHRFRIDLQNPNDNNNQLSEKNIRKILLQYRTQIKTSSHPTYHTVNNKYFMDKMGMSHCIENDKETQRIFFGIFGEEEGSMGVYRIRCILYIPNGIKYEKASESGDEKPNNSDLPCLDGHYSIARKDRKSFEIGKDAQKRYVDHLLSLEETELRLNLQYLTGGEYIGIDRKSIGQIVHEWFIKIMESSGMDKDWILMKEKPINSNVKCDEMFSVAFDLS